MTTLSLVLLIAAFVVFVLAALSVNVQKVALVPLGLALWLLSSLVTHLSAL